MGTKTLILKEKKENPNKKPETKSNKYYNNLNKTPKMTKMMKIQKIRKNQMMTFAKMKINVKEQLKLTRQIKKT